MRFENKVGIVTGASRGIGFAVAQRLVDEGAKVVLTARKPEPLAEAAARLGGPDVALAVAGNAADPAHQAEAVAAAVERFGSLDLLVNNTGINPAYGPLMGLDLDVARKILDTNVVAALAWVQRAHAAWMGEHGGSIVNVGSVAGLRAAPGIGFYGASKAALLHLTEELAVELGPTIRVNAVAPAVVKTDFAKALYEGREEKAARGYALKRLGTPEDVAGAVAYLLSDDAAWTTGVTTILDGGATLVDGSAIGG